MATKSDNTRWLRLGETRGEQWRLPDLFFSEVSDACGCSLNPEVRAICEIANLKSVPSRRLQLADRSVGVSEEHSPLRTLYSLRTPHASGISAAWTVDGVTRLQRSGSIPGLFASFTAFSTAGSFGCSGTSCPCNDGRLEFAFVHRYRLTFVATSRWNPRTTREGGLRVVERS